MTQQMVDITKAPAIEPRLQSFEQLYTLRRPLEVLEFLEAHPSLVPLLLEAQGLVKVFGYIVTSLTPEEAGKQLRQFDRGWFLSQISRAEGLLNFDVEFQ